MLIFLSIIISSLKHFTVSSMSLENIAIATGFSASPFVISSGGYLVHAVMHFCDEFFNLFEYFPSVDSSFKIYCDFKHHFGFKITT